MLNQETADFVTEMKPTDHVIMFYSKPEDKRQVLFTYLRAGLERGEAAAYIASQESPDEIVEGMRLFGVDVDGLQKSGALCVLSYNDFYFKGGEFSVSGTMALWKNMLEEATAKGFKGLRVTGEMACFFEKNMVKDLLVYEKALHKVLDLSLSAICAYDSNSVSADRNPGLFLDLTIAHSSVIVTGPTGGFVRSV
jgi:hypothetical protein